MQHAQMKIPGACSFEAYAPGNMKIYEIPRFALGDVYVLPHCKPDMVVDEEAGRRGGRQGHPWLDGG